MNNKVLMENLRCIPDFPVKGINFRDVTTLFKNAECVKIMLDELEALYKDKGITKIVGIESRGFVMASALAGRLGCGIVLARKPGKLPSTAIKETFSKEYGVDIIEIHIDSINENDVVNIPPFTPECRLQKFYADHNFLEDLSGLTALPYLNYVTLDYNNIGNIDALADCANLVQVNVFHTNIGSAEEVKALTDRSIIVNYTPNY